MFGLSSLSSMSRGVHALLCALCGVLATCSSSLPTLAELETQAAELRGSCTQSEEVVWLDLESPAPETRHVSPVGFTLVRGRAGAGAPTLIDVMILVDRSKSAFALAGVDVDGDGIVGARLEGSRVLRKDFEDGELLEVESSDDEDTIIRAELVAARGLLERVDPLMTRMGLIAFAGAAHVKAPIENPSPDLVQRVTELRLEPGQGGTNFHAALVEALLALGEAPVAAGQRRHCLILLLSDGRPTEPEPELKAEAEAIAAAKLAAQAHVRIYSLVLGSRERIRTEVFEHLARITDGEVLYFDNPGEVMTYLPHINLTRLESLSIENVTTEQEARAQRMLPDGRFDAYAPLVPGENVIRVTGRALGGAVASVERRVFFERREPNGPQEVQEVERLYDEIRARTIEMSIISRLKNKRGNGLQRDLRIEAEE